MDGAQEVERKRMAGAVSANVHTRARRCVSFGEPEENMGVQAEFAILGRFRWTMTSADRFAAGAKKSESVRVEGFFRGRRGLINQSRGTRPRATGQTVVEMALLLPVLLTLMIGLIEIGRYAYFDILISNAARAGAQYGAQSLIQAADKNGIIAAAQNDGLTTMNITTSQECGCVSTALGGCPSGAVCPLPLVYVQVTATETYSSLFKYPGIPKTMKLTSTVMMRVSQ
jgi:Flp pilus assembly protein TadG